MKPLCIYHGGCADGFSAAWVVRKYFLGQVDFLSADYGDRPPDVHGRDVFIVDFSYPRGYLLRMLREAESLTILDHHQSAQSALADLPGAIVRFSIGLSGAMLAWKYFFHDATPPRLLQHIQDRDLWLFQLDATREIMAGLFSYPYDFALYDQWMESERLDGLAADGAAILRKQHQDLDQLLPLLTQRFEICGKMVPVANLPHIFASDAGARLAIGHPFAATYSDGPHGRRFSLRSIAPHGDDVAAIAQSMGGGGHRHASGFLIPGGLWTEEGQ
jgi:hypothetical protein